MTIARLAMAAVSLGAGVTHCSTNVTTTARPHQQIYISMTYGAPFDAQPGDTVNIIMEPGAADPQGFCDVRGGSLWMNPFTGILICEDVDF